ncbi:MAG: NAD(P)-binding domain-containing protein [Clostridia bacterium]|nr:NAD(P)-binding domain-containing protein [Clostridia bacterium]
MNKKVTIIGAGRVGSTIAYTLMAKGNVNEIVLIDIDKARADAETLDIKQSSIFLSETSIKSGSYEDSKDSDIVIITSGISRKVGQSRLELTQTNVNILKSITKQVEKLSPNAIFVLVSNPVDILTYCFHKFTTVPENRIIGTGTLLDTMRLKVRLSEITGTPIKDVNSIMLGEHGDSCVFPWSLSNVKLSENEKQEVEEFVKNSGASIISGKGATFYGIAAAVSKLVDCIVLDTNEVLPVSVMLSGEFGIEDVCLGLPCRVGANGKEKVEIKLSESEEVALKNSASKLKDIISQIEC